MVKAKLPELRMIVVAGPRIDAASLAAPAGVEVRAFVANLDRHLAACDLALVQGGLTTCMELAAAGTPFVYFPLRNHFEQTFMSLIASAATAQAFKWISPPPRRT